MIPDKRDDDNGSKEETREERLAKADRLIAEIQKKYGPPTLTREEINEIEDRLNTELRNMNRARRIHTNQD